MTFFSDVLCVLKCASKTNTPNLENAVSILKPTIVHKVHLMIEEEISVVMFAFLSIYTGISVTIYSTIELSNGIIVLGQPLKI